MTTVEVLSVRHEGSVAVLYAVDRHGRECAVAAEPRMARDIAEAIELDEHPRVAVESWQFLPGYPGGPDREEVGAFG